MAGSIYYSLVIGPLAGVVVALWYHVVLLGRRCVKLEDDVERVRMATYELTTMAQDDIHDLQDSLRAVHVPISRDHQRERMRRRSLTPEESMAEFEAVVAQTQDLMRQARESYEGGDCESPDSR